ncbi:hypothetical protein QBC34DRAFT_499856 [Podospora aff. communis PSN243]|uniref:Clr5 domain-containing protein n=1 Tax=Podospora aff. communis PSN243 TaxID=3040156 RepID=A0AAV9G430_9PEZI|nr:hypothetical protein QBC34DRAFT_499856 [Podospora aff. communis PSN243]
MNPQNGAYLLERFAPSVNAQPADPEHDPHAFPPLGHHWQDTASHPPSTTWHHDDLSATSNIHLVQTPCGANWTNAEPHFMINQTINPFDQNYPLDFGFTHGSSMAPLFSNVDGHLPSGISNTQHFVHDNQPSIGIPCEMIPDKPRLSCRRAARRDTQARAGRGGSVREQRQRHSRGPGRDPPEAGRPSTPKTQVAPRKKIEWEKWKELLKHMYLDVNHTAEDICFELELVYNFDIAKSSLKNKLSQWKITKNNTGRTKQQQQQIANVNRRTRRKTARPAVDQRYHIFKKHMCLSRKYGDPGMFPSISQEPHGRQIKMLHAIGNFANGLAGREKRDAPLPGHISLWQLTSDRCQKFASIFESKTGQIPVFLFNRLLNDLASNVVLNDAMFLVYLWRICLSLSRTRFAGRNNNTRFIFVRLFLQRMHHALRNIHGNGDHPLAVILGALVRIIVDAPEAFKWSLIIGSWKSRDMLDEGFGRTRDVYSLEVGAFCVQNWRSHLETDFGKLQARYLPLIHSEAPDPWPEDKIAALVGYTPQNDEITPVLLPHLAILLKRTSTLSQNAAEAGNLRYGTTASAFAFSTVLVSKHLLDGKQHHIRILQHALSPSQPYDEYMDIAIRTLSRGDMDCQIRAYELSKRLSVWLKTFRLGEKTQSRDLAKDSKRGRLRPRGRDSLPDFMKERGRASRLQAQLFKISGYTSFKDTGPGRKERGWVNRRRRQLREDHAQELQCLYREAGLGIPEARPSRRRPPSAQSESRDQPLPVAGHHSNLPPDRRTCKVCQTAFPSRRGLKAHLEACKECRVEGPHPWQQPVDIGPTIDPRALGFVA